MTHPTERTDERARVILDLYPNCAYCGFSLRGATLGNLVPVFGRDRMAHRDCLAAEAEEPGDAA